MDYLIDRNVDVLQASLDTPKQDKVIEGVTRFSGWCAHHNKKIICLTLNLGNKTQICEYGIERTDVLSSLPDLSGKGMVGFETRVKLDPGKYSLTLEALFEDKSIGFIDLGKVLHIMPQPLFDKILKYLFKSIRKTRLGHFIVYCNAGLKNWIKTHERLPYPQEFIGLTIKAFNYLRKSFRSNLGNVHELPQGFSIPHKLEAYQAWLAINKWTDADSKNLRLRLAKLDTKCPTISIIMPVYNPPKVFFEEAIGSVLNQIYKKWELCIADDASSEGWIQDYLKELCVRDNRIKVHFCEKNSNISVATNKAADLATGEFLLFLDQDDLLSIDALAEFALYIATHPQTDVLYSDDDKITEDGKRFSPQFKPNWSPELLLSYMYLSHAFAVRRTLFQAVGGFRTGYEGSQDYDLALRVTEHARHVGHIPFILYHWRVLPGSTASSGDAKPDSYEAGKQAIADALERRNIIAKVYRPEWAIKAKVGIFWHKFSDDGPSVTLIIPTKNQLAILKRCIDSLARTNYKNYHVTIIDNDSDDEDTLAYLREVEHEVVRLSSPNDIFNYSYINNRAAECASTDYVLFLNNDTEIICENWLCAMVGYAQLEGVGAVGARLLYYDGRIQHAGIVHGYYDNMAGPAMRLLPRWDHGYLSYAMVTRNYSAVTAACLLTPTRLFRSIGGFNEQEFAVSYNDVDYCYRLVKAGYRCVYTPSAELYHHEGVSRGFYEDPLERLAFRKKYNNWKEKYYNPNLSLDNERFDIDARRLLRGSLGQPTPAVKVLMCAFNLNWEGAPFSQYELTLALRDTGVILPIVYSPSDGPLRLAYERAGIKVHCSEHPLVGVADVPAYISAINKFSKFITELAPEIVYANTLQTFYAIQAAHQLGIPSIWNIRESEPWQSYFSFYGEAISAKALSCFRYPYKNIFVAHATRARFEELNSANNFCVIHNGLNLARLNQEKAQWSRQTARESLNISPNEIMILLLGTVCERKGQQDLVKAITEIADEPLSKIRCYIVGDRSGLYSSEMHHLIHMMPQEKSSRISIIEETNQTSRYFLSADIFVCSSRVESYPRVILEAMAYGLPIITTPVFGISEQVRNNVNGIFYKPGDICALAEAIEQLVSNEQRRMEMAVNSKHVFEGLSSFEEMVRDYRVIIQEAKFAII